MSATMTQAPGQEKKETTVKVTVKSWDSMGKKFLKPQEDVDARRVELKGAHRVLHLGKAGYRARTANHRF
ncbi:unnamed protein product [Gemmata massiliana]|uniref:Uncharacterized protein n=1 Tax=Gemmata massiliana TaxID=1210884 RepID=A0A6P2D9H3_9BACT|nr:hypothetical protein [Gemmata massiliana]VTR97829.1 unnamed protein product [Gemmata massiliana]